MNVKSTLFVMQELFNQTISSIKQKIEQISIKTFKKFKSNRYVRSFIDKYIHNKAIRY